ncbi:MAG: DUF11 domain-containing protein [Chloroflexi bacterium]|nr:DUF11 domain-containing protein [Chloroflexota bacterium]
MIGSIIDKVYRRVHRAERDQRGGIAILTALGFLLFSVPLITGSLNLAQNTSIDARVKTDITHRQYCGLAVQEYLNYLILDETRWADWLTANVDPSDPTGATSTETVEPCGRNITITVAQQSVLPPGSTSDPIGDPLALIPPLSAYGNRDFQTSKKVSDPNPSAGASVTYTITVVNRDNTATTLTQIEDMLPPGFSYDCNGPANRLTLPGTAAQDIVPKEGPCPDPEDDEIVWDMPPGTSIQPGAGVILTFTAVTSVLPGTYCNEIEVGPGGTKTRSGKTAIVQIGAISGLCAGEAVVVTKSVDSAVLASTDTTTAPYTYTFDIGFTIKIENIGTEDLTLKEFIDLLPVGFSYVSTSPSGDITDIPDQLHHENQVDRQRVTWKFNPNVPLASGTSKTLKFSTTAAITKGDYWSDLLVDFGGGSFSEDRYTWPAALVSVKDVYNVTATDDAGNNQILSLQVWIGDENGVINIWNLQ